MSLVDATKLRDELEQRSRRNRSAAPGCSTKAVRREMEVTADTYDKVIALIDRMVQAAQGQSEGSQAPQQEPEAITLKVDDFVRVKGDAEFRPGQDGQVVAPQDADGNVGLIFAYDRHGDPVMARGPSGDLLFVPSAGTELWHVSELDLTDVDR